MATAAELLASKSSTDKTLVIDNDLRTIKIPSSITNLGVENDDDVLRLDFRMPRYLGKTDLSTFSVRINYLNANGQGDVYTVDDVKIVGDNLTFSWLVGPTATAYKGNTKFNVCMKIVDSESYVQKEYNTTIATLPVLEGLETEEGLVAYYSDILEQWKNQLFGIGDTEEANLTAKSEEERANIAQKGIEVLATIPEDYQTTYEMANNAYRTRANAIVSTVQGETIYLDDASDDPLRGLRVFGKTTQVTTTGTNLLPLTEDSEKIDRGIAFTISGGVCRAVGTSTSESSFNITLLGAYSGTDTIFTLEAGTYTVTDCVLFNYDGTTRTVYEDTFTLTEATNITWVSTRTYLVSEIVKEYTYPRVNSGDGALDWEPYSGGYASPHPEWPQEVVSIESPIASVYNANLFPIQEISGFNVIATPQADGSVLYEGTSTGNAWAIHQDCPLPATATYTLHVITTGKTEKGSLIQVFSPTGVTVISQINNIEDYYLVFQGEAGGKVRWNIGVKTDEVVSTDVKLMVNVGGTALDWEAHQTVQTITPAYTLRGIPVSSNGNYTDSDGQQWICDEIDFERGVYVQRIGIETFDGTSSSGWSYVNMYGTALRFDYSSAKVIPHTRVLANWLPEAIIATPNAEGINVHGTQMLIQVQILKTRLSSSDVSGLMEYFATNPLTVEYVLATPIETALTAEELVIFGDLHSNYLNTTILNDAGATMEVKYNEDLKMYADEIVQDAAEAVITQDKIQTAVDAWLTAHYSSAEGVSF